jgi:SNF2 family DNA or RNA helicase
MKQYVSYRRSYDMQVSYDRSTRRYYLQAENNREQCLAASVPGIRKEREGYRLSSDKFSVPELGWHSLSVMFPESLPIIEEAQRPIHTGVGICNVTEKYDLDEYQKSGAYMMARHNGTAVLDVMGLGKTIQVLSAYYNRYTCGRQSTRLLVFCTKLAKESPWLREFRENFGKHIPEETIYITNYEQAASEKGREKINEFVNQVPLEQVMVCIDEIHNIAGLSSKRLQFIDALISNRPFHRVAITGTFVRNRLDSFFAPYKLLTGADITFKEYQDIFFHKNLGVWINPEHIEPVMKTFSVRRTKKEVGLDVNRVVIDTIKMPITGFQKELYDAKLAEYRLLKKEYKSGKIKKDKALSKIAELVTIISHPVVYYPDAPDIDVNKIQALIELIINSDEPWVIWSVHPKTLQRLAEIFEDWNPVVIVGGDNNPQEKLDYFLNNPESRLLLLSIGACNQSVDGIQKKCSNAVYFDISWKPTEIDQSYARIDRRGQQTGVINIYHLVYENTIDYRMYQVVQEKLNLRGIVLGDTDVLRILFEEDL